MRHGLTAEIVIGALEDAEDYGAFEAANLGDYDAQSAVERELVLRLASLLWRLRRATTMETGCSSFYLIGGNAEKKNIEVVQSICRIIDELVPGDSSPRERLITFVEDRPGHDFRCSIDASRTNRNLVGFPGRPSIAGCGAP